MGVFKVLMWKHYTVRKRRVVQTIIEFLSPSSIIVVLFLLKGPMIKKHESLLRDEPLVERFSLNSVDIPMRILYTPDSPATRQIMDKVSVALDMEHSKKSTNKNVSEFFAFLSPKHNVSQMNDSDTEPKHEIVVKFNNMEGSEIPSRLDYTLRTLSFDARKKMSEEQRTFQAFDKSRKLFIRAQWAIDTSFVQLKSDDKQDLPIQDLTLQTLAQLPVRRAGVNRKYVNNIFYLLPYMSFLSPILPFILLMTRLLEERSSGIQELVKMVGVTPAMLALTQYINTLPSCVIFTVLTTALLKASDSPMVPSTSALIISIGSFLHFNTLIALAYACSYIVRNANYTVSLAMFVYIGAWMPIRWFEPDGRSDLALLLLGLLPHCPVYWFLNEMHMTEIYYQQVGITFNNWATQHGVYFNNGTNGSVMFAFIMQLVQIALLSAAAWYLERVRPGRYGIAQPWNFPCMALLPPEHHRQPTQSSSTSLHQRSREQTDSGGVSTQQKGVTVPHVINTQFGHVIAGALPVQQKEYWARNKHVPEVVGPTATARDPAYSKYFEDPPNNMYAGIKISHVSKIFGSGKKKFQALNDVTFEVYKGEITVLLGHNGAGKTTIMSIITGMINPTSGKIYVNGLDTVTQQHQIRRQLGLCPQHNLFFRDLTVLEHFLFFTMIKGGTLEEARKCSMELLERLALKEKAHRKTSELSGGMLRRLQLGCALCGDANVLILDEPTSGLDVEARRELWDMLLALRGDRTLLLSTHFMEEADVLGDRLAALHAGHLRCHASPMFLKRAVGSGFRIKISTIKEPNEAAISAAVRAAAPQASLKERGPASLVYDVPAGADLPALFDAIERQKAQLSIDSLGVGITTLEEVFIELCCDVDTQVKMEDETRGPVQYQYVTGRRLLLRQLRALFKRQIDYTRHKITAYLILQVLMPYVMCTALAQLFNNQYVDVSLQLSLHMYHGLADPRAAYRLRGQALPPGTLDAIALIYPSLQLRSVEEFPNVSCTCGHPNPKRDEYLVGIDINDKQVRVLYDPTLKYTASVGVNLLSNLLAAYRLHDASGRTIATKILNDNPLQDSAYHVPKSKSNCALFAIFNIFILMATSVNDVGLPCKERLSVARHTHGMAGCPPALHWAASFLYHMAGFLLFCFPASLLAAAICDNDKTIDDPQTLRAFGVALVLSGMDFYVFAYFVSYYFNERGATMFIIGLTIIFGFLSPMLMMGLEDVKTSSSEPAFNAAMNALGALLPAHAITQAAVRMTETSRLNSFCKHNHDKCPNLFDFGDGFDIAKCCDTGSATFGPFNHFAFNRHAMGVPLVLIVVQFFVFGALVLLVEYGYCSRWWTRLGQLRGAPPPPRRYRCPHAAAEKRHVTQAINQPPEQIEDTLLLSKAWKTYYKLFRKPTFALKDANFSVKKGECFGILGVNGAGKTTTFKVLSHEEPASKGRNFVNGHFLHTNPTMYMRSLGYCPQFFGLDEFRSGANNLRMLLTLRGYSDVDVERETAAWLEVSGMSKHGGRAVAGYSGGMVRRLAAAAALCGGARVTLLDEPTAGVDTAARRLMWAALRRGLRHGRAIVFTSHNTDEMEMLCSRVTILSRGEMSVLGAPLALRDQFAAGHTVLVKMHAHVVQAPSGQEKVRQLKNRLEGTFNCSLKDQHLTSLHYRINEKLQYSDIFTKIEAVEKEFSDLVEDYSVTDTTLEDVFLTFASEADDKK